MLCQLIDSHLTSSLDSSHIAHRERARVYESPTVEHEAGVLAKELPNPRPIFTLPDGSVTKDAVEYDRETALEPAKLVWAWRPEAGELRFQGTPLVDTVGVEWYDMSPWSGGACPSGKVRRYSDAVLVRYTRSVSSLGLLARASGGGTTITDTVTYFRSNIDINQPPPRVTGMNSGEVSGTLTNTCVNYYPDSATYAGAGVIIPGNMVLLCQYKTSGMSLYSGDSGGPAWEDFDDSPWFHFYYLWGIFHASSGSSVQIFSDLDDVDHDVGTLKWSRY